MNVSHWALHLCKVLMSFDPFKNQQIAVSLYPTWSSWCWVWVYVKPSGGHWRWVDSVVLGLLLQYVDEAMRMHIYMQTMPLERKAALKCDSRIHSLLDVCVCVGGGRWPLELCRGAPEPWHWRPLRAWIYHYLTLTAFFVRHCYSAGLKWAGNFPPKPSWILIRPSILLLVIPLHCLFISALSCMGKLDWFGFQW